ncbi:MAG: flagellar filament capping protein FliD [Opitutae bacterium]|nr:flagellar filament capping protein FliD [Opitutae bacterium]
MAGLQLSGLASGFDWKTLVDQLMELEHVPVDRLEKEKANNTKKLDALNLLKDKLTALDTATAALKADGLFTGRSASSSSSSSTWSLSAATGATTGSTTIAVTRLATQATRTGSSNIGKSLAESPDVSGLTLASLPTATAVTAGTFTVNGQKVTIALTDSLQDVFTKIATATSGDVTASYDNNTDKVTLASGSSSEIVIGASNDTSNFLSVMRLTNNGGTSVSSGSALGKTSTTATLANARLRNPITAVDGSGNGSFTINGVAISYNVNTDSLSAVIARVNASSAGVTASYDTANDRVKFTNSATGDLGMTISETAGGLLDAIGFSTGGTLEHGLNAQISVNGGPTITTTSNTFDATVHGITGLSVTAKSATTETISVAANTDAMTTAINTFVSKFNDVQDYIEEKTKITVSNGKVTAALLSNNREVQEWSRSLRSLAFNTVSGLSGSISKIDDIGLDFVTGTSKLQIKNSTKLSAALSGNAVDVAAFFTTSTTGFASRIDSFITTTLGSNGTGGNLGTQTSTITKESSRLDQQITDMERRLEEQRSRMEAAFIRMEEAQQKLKTVQQQLNNAFFKTSSS